MTWSFGREDGEPQVTVAATGRSLDDPSVPLVAVAEMTYAGLLATCAATAPELTRQDRRSAPGVPDTWLPVTSDRGRRLG